MSGSLKVDGERVTRFKSGRPGFAIAKNYKTGRNERYRALGTTTEAGRWPVMYRVCGTKRSFPVGEGLFGVIARLARSRRPREISTRSLAGSFARTNNARNRREGVINFSLSSFASPRDARKCTARRDSARRRAVTREENFSSSRWAAQNSRSRSAASNLRSGLRCADDGLGGRRVHPRTAPI